MTSQRSLRTAGGSATSVRRLVRWHVRPGGGSSRAPGRQGRGIRGALRHCRRRRATSGGSTARSSVRRSSKVDVPTPSASSCALAGSSERDIAARHELAVLARIGGSRLHAGLRRCALRAATHQSVGDDHTARLWWPPAAATTISSRRRTRSPRALQMLSATSSTGQGHVVDPKVMAAVLTRFFSA